MTAKAGFTWRVSRTEDSAQFLDRTHCKKNSVPHITYTLSHDNTPCESLSRDGSVSSLRHTRHAERASARPRLGIGSGPAKARKILQHDNARPHISRQTQDASRLLELTTLQDPAYSSDLAPSDYYP
ncbi:histone-lysine N-methyltransferase SETMAR [Elysia marginata]|uniref:Histone-lysine N-methyltransferase SETMAR n=1 Tax=Elysia marginata TaxID=1093978 RepID=A0AAV4HCE2_9GAST|nr:histone-lysine N-methyltransferase SETMAR [Elysia marginata]